MILLVVSAGAFPFGGAATNRHISYLKGLVELGSQVKVYLLQHDKNQSIESKNCKGNFYGIEYEYTSQGLNQQNNLIKKIALKIRSHKIIYRKILIETKRKENMFRILVLTTKPFDVLPYFYLAKKHKIPIYHERTEYPFINATNLMRKISLWFYLKYLIPRFDGIFVITKALVEYFNKYLFDQKRIIHIPMTVEVQRFSENKERITEYGEYIAYCGSMYTDKDGVPDLIKAFNILGESYKNIKLVLIGDNTDKLKFKLNQKYIDESPFNERIYCTGQIDRNDMPKYLNSAKILALARPDNIQAKGGFPTKLGEYLATGKPIVVTKVGEIPDYLIDRESAFLSEPDDPKEFARKLIEVLSNYDFALTVGQKGKNVALNTFSYKVQSAKLFQFLKKQIG